MFDIVGKKNLFFVISSVIVLISLVSLAVNQLKLGVDFSGGSLTTITFTQTVGQADLERELETLGYNQARVQFTSEGSYSIRTGPLTNETKAALEEQLKARFGELSEKGFDRIDPTIAKETGRIALVAVLVAAAGILLYIWWAFRKMPHPFRFGSAAVIAIMHDVVVVLGVFSILGAIWRWEIDLMFITGILAVIGYSINNTVIIFDRIRENVRLGISADFAEVVNSSLIETLGRSLNTNITTLIVIGALMLFVGATIQNFLLVLMVGIIVGAYDSICVAPSLLVVWQKGRAKA